MIRKGPATAEDLLAMPADGQRYELVRGDLRMMTPAGYEHGRVTVTITRILADFVEQHELGHVLAAETGFKLESDPDTVRAADVSFVSKNRVPPKQQQRAFPELAPDLIVEIVSPNDTGAAVEEEVQDYLRAGVRLIWIADPGTRTVVIHQPAAGIRTLAGEQVIDGADVLPGFRCRVTDLFPAE